MADNTTLNSMSGGDVIAADDISGVKFQRVKVIIGADGVNDGDVSEANPLPIHVEKQHTNIDSSTANLNNGANYTTQWFDSLTGGANIRIFVKGDKKLKVTHESSINGSTVAASHDHLIDVSKAYSRVHGFFARYGRFVITNIDSVPTTSLFISATQSISGADQTEACPSEDRTETPLAASATYTSSVFNTKGKGYGVSVYIKADQDGTIYGDYSHDGTTWNLSDSHVYTANTTFEHLHMSNAAYFRVRFVNGSTLQTSFIMHCIQRDQPSNQIIAIDPNNNMVTQGGVTWVTKGEKASDAGTPDTDNFGTLPAVATTAAPSYTTGNQVALSTDTSGNVRSRNDSGSQVDGHSATLGATGDADTASTVIGRLKKLVNLLPTALSGNGALKVEQVVAGPAQPTTSAVSSQVDGHSVSIGATSDADTALTVIGRIKKIVTLLAGGLPAALGANGGVKADCLSLPSSTVAGASSLPAGTNNIGDVDVLTLPSGTVAGSASLPAGSAIVGKIGIDQTTPGTTNRVDIGAALPAGTNNIGKVDVNSITAGSNIIGKIGIDQTTPGTTNGVQVNAALPTGSNVIGKVSIDQTTPGTTNAVQVSAALPAGTNAIGKLASNTGVNIGTTDINSLPSGVIAGMTTLPAGSNLVGKVGIDQTTPGTTNRVDIGAALPAGTNAIGKLAANAGVNIGAVDINSMPNEGQQTMANSISCAIASDQSAVPVSDSVVSATFKTLTVDFTASQTAATIWTPTSGKKFVITDMIVSASAAGVITIFDNTDSTTYRVAKLNLAQNGGAVCNYRKPYVSAAANNVLKYTTGTGIAGSITVNGYEI